MQGNLEILEKEEEDVHEAVKANTRALNESLGLLQKFEGWMDRLLQEKDDLISRWDSHSYIFTVFFPVRSSSSRSCDSNLSLTHALGEQSRLSALMTSNLSRSLENLANILVEVLDR